MVVSLTALLVAIGHSAASYGGDLTLNKISPNQFPHAKCLDGTPPAYYWRDGIGARARSLILFLEGGGWCYPSEIQQPCEPSTSHCTANCHIRANSTHGSSLEYPESIPAGAIEGGTGYVSGDPNKTKFADFAVAYARYCDGGSFSGTKTTPDIALNGTGPLYYAGKFNLDAVLTDILQNHSVINYENIILSGCSAGGMACTIHCDYVANFIKQRNPHINFHCICDAGFFIDIDTVTGAGNIMEQRFFDLADKMDTKTSLNPRCVATESDWRMCMFSEIALKYTKTPLFVINSMYNFGEWEMLAPITNQNFPPDTTASAADWASCWPGVSKLTPSTYKNCNATQRDIIATRLKVFKEKLAPATSPDTPHGAWLDSCPTLHCQTGFDPDVLVKNTAVGDAVAAWYLDNETVKYTDVDFPGNPTCPGK